MYFNSANLNLDILSIIKTTFTLIIKIKWKKLNKNTVLILIIIAFNGKYYIFYNSA